MKNILRKVCLLSSCALVALGISVPMASAAAPTGSDAGTLWNDTVTIGKGSYVYDLTLELASGLTYDGTAKQLITGVTNGVPAHGVLYLRVGGATPESVDDWVQYTGASALENEALKRTAVGTYNVYYYMDTDDDSYNVSVNPLVPNTTESGTGSGTDNSGD